MHVRFVALLLAGLLAACSRAPDPAPQATAPTAKRKPASAAAQPPQVERPSLRVTTLDGAEYDLAGQRGKWVIVNYWATWCGPCIKEMPELAAFSQAQGNEGVQVLGLALDDAAAVEAWLARLPSPYPHYRDDAGPRDAGVVLGNPAGVLPYSVLVDAQGIVRKQQVGPFASADELAEWTDLAGR